MTGQIKYIRIPVSYTHLDVYKRQGIDLAQVILLRIDGISDKNQKIFITEEIDRLCQTQTAGQKKEKIHS